MPILFEYCKAQLGLPKSTNTNWISRKILPKDQPNAGRERSDIWYHAQINPVSCFFSYVHGMVIFPNKRWCLFAAKHCGVTKQKKNKTYKGYSFGRMFNPLGID